MLDPYENMVSSKKKKKNDEGDANLSRENLDYFGSLTHLCLASVIKGLPSGSVCLTFDR